MKEDIKFFIGLDVHKDSISGRHRQLAGPVELVGRRARILLVEDNGISQLIAQEILRDAGFVVDEADDGAKAIEKVRANAYDVVLMDMQMPVMDGVAATRAIRQLPGLAVQPIIAMTANAMEESREACIAAGMNDHWAKPIDTERLWAALKKWIAPTRGRGT